MPDTLAAAPDTVVGHHVEWVMGTVVSFDLRQPVPRSALEAAIASLHHADATFSLYRPDSDMSRLAAGTIPLGECHPDVHDVLALCAEATSSTGGYFSAVIAGQLDPTGLVKGWAVQRASQILDDAGSRHHAVNGGGDVQFGGVPPEEPWQVGVADPQRPGEVAVVAALYGGGIATSGSAERGAHIIDPLNGRPARHFSSVTVTAPSLLVADVFATAAFARGESAIDWLDGVPDVEALFIGPGTRLTATHGFPIAG